MNQARIKELRTELENESISLGELLEIQTAFEELYPDVKYLDDIPMASDMLDELEQDLYEQTHFTEGISI